MCLMQFYALILLHIEMLGRENIWLIYYETIKLNTY